MEPSSAHLSSLSLAQWIPYTKVYLKKGTKDGRKYTYLRDNDSQISTFTDKREAENFNYRKLNLVKIISITEDKIKEHIDQKGERGKTLKKGRKILEKLQEKAAIEDLTSTGEIDFSLTEIDQIKLNEEGDVISEEMYQNTIEVAENLFRVSRSTGGTTGVCNLVANKLILDEQGSLPDLKLKFIPLNEISSHVVADKFLQLFGFTTPRYCAIKANSKLGKLVCAKLTALKGKRNWVNLDPEKVKKKIEDSSYLVVMQTVPGTPFDQLTQEQVKHIFFKFVNDYEELFVTLGEMVFFDTFMDNKDRLNWETCNNGNYLLCFKDQGDELEASNASKFLLQPGKKCVSLIDHDFQISNLVFLEKAKKNLIYLFDPKNRVEEKILEVLLKSFQVRQKVADSLDHSKKRFIEKCLLFGIRNAAQQLVSKFSHQGELLAQELLTLPPEMTKFSPNDLLHLVNLVKGLIRPKNKFSFLNIIK